MSSSFLLIGFLIAILLTRSVTPTTYQVDVGRNGQFYVPNTTTTRNVGDQVQFNFYNNHSVVEADFSTPCKPLYGGFYSGFIPMPLDSPAAPQHFVVTIKDTEPHYFYCAQEGMCWEGMVGVINPPANQPDDLAGWVIRAAETDMNASPEVLAPPNAPIGGVIKIESSAAPVSAASDSYFSDPLRFASRPITATTTATTNTSFVPTAIISDTTSISIAPTSVSAGSSSSRVSNVTSTVAVTPTSSAALTSSMSATSSPLAPSASTKKGAAGRVDAGDMGLAMVYFVILIGIILRLGNLLFE